MKILCAIDNSLNSRYAVEALAKLFHHTVQEVVFCHALDLHPFIKDNKGLQEHQALRKTLTHKLESLGRKHLREAVNRFHAAHQQATTHPLTTVNHRLLKGPAATAVIAFAERIRPDLVVVGSRGLKDLPGYLLGSVSRQTLLHSPCSVFVVKGAIEHPLSALIGVDGSKHSKFAVNRGLRWLPPEEMAIHVASVVPEPLTELASEVLSKAQMRTLKSPLKRHANETLTAYRELFLKEGFRVTKGMLEGNPRERLLEIIEERNPSLVMLGSKGLSGQARFAMGSVSEWIGTYSPVSVLIIRR